MCHSDNPLKNRPFCANTALKDHGTRQRYRGLSLCLTQKCLIFKCLAVLPMKIFSCKDGLKPQEYCRISRLKTCLREKRSRQNRVSHCGAPPEGEIYLIFSCFRSLAPSRRITYAFGSDQSNLHLFSFSENSRFPHLIVSRETFINFAAKNVSRETKPLNLQKHFYFAVCCGIIS